MNEKGMNNENIDMQNISESRGIAHTADAIFALFQMPEDREAGIINARVIKNRLGGRVGKTLKTRIDPNNLTIHDLSDNPDLVRDLQINTSASKEAENILRNSANISSDLDEI